MAIVKDYCDGSTKWIELQNLEGAMQNGSHELWGIVNGKGHRLVGSNKCRF